MSEDGQSNLTHGDTELPSEPVYYLRRAVPVSIATWAAVFGCLLAGLTYSRSIEQALRAEITNAENRILNRLQNDEATLRDCCGGRK